jgi:hypothetical protein
MGSASYEVSFIVRKNGAGLMTKLTHWFLTEYLPKFYTLSLH